MSDAVDCMRYYTSLRVSSGSTLYSVQCTVYSVHYCIVAQKGRTTVCMCMYADTNSVEVNIYYIPIGLKGTVKRHSLGLLNSNVR